jgi:SpoVK/Ycf46/Vps4 family AAA+-type ATPase
MKFINTPNGYTVTSEQALNDRLPSGAFRLSYNSRNNMLFYNQTKLEYDKLVDLPSKEFNSIVKEMDQFLKSETKQSYIDHGFIYKRSFFLHGNPGTGKSCIVNRVCEKVISSGGIVIFNDNIHVTLLALEELKNVLPDVLTLVIFEEFDEIISSDEENMLRLLDGQVQKNNAIYLGTTNFLNKIPKRILRPGRFSRVVEVLPPSIEARSKYIQTVSKNKLIVNELSEKTEGFTIDELKEAVLSINCLGYKLDEAVTRIKETSEITDRLKDNSREDDADLDDLF